MVRSLEGRESCIRSDHSRKSLVISYRYFAILIIYILHLVFDMLIFSCVLLEANFKKT